MRENLVLIGLMGCGKSTLAKALGRQFRMEVIDADAEIERRAGVPIATIFELAGEAAFRDREQQLMEELAAGGRRQSAILATGGGVVMRTANRAALRQFGVVVYLHAPPEVLYDRTKNTRHRPLLQTEDPLGRLQALYQLRDPLYRATADWVIESAPSSVVATQGLVGQILLSSR